ncbi:hypothetical protein D3C81_1039100 [compost metagenome]
MLLIKGPLIGELILHIENSGLGSFSRNKVEIFCSCFRIDLAKEQRVVFWIGSYWLIIKRVVLA